MNNACIREVTAIPPLGGGVVHCFLRIVLLYDKAPGLKLVLADTRALRGAFQYQEAC